ARSAFRKAFRQRLARSAGHAPRSNPAGPGARKRSRGQEGAVVQEMQVTEELDVSFVQTPHEVLKRLREAGPAVKVMLPNGSLVWIVTRYDEVRQALGENGLSKNFKGLNELMTKHTKEGHAPKQYDEALVGHMLASDPPDHTRMRRLVNKAFTPRRVEGMRP